MEIDRNLFFRGNRPLSRVTVDFFQCWSEEPCQPDFWTKVESRMQNWSKVSWSVWMSIKNLGFPSFCNKSWASFNFTSIKKFLTFSTSPANFKQTRAVLISKNIWKSHALNHSTEQLSKKIDVNWYLRKQLYAIRKFIILLVKLYNQHMIRHHLEC